MTTIVGVLFIALILFIIWRRLNNNYLSEDFKYKMFALRDKLRYHAAIGEIKSDSKSFSYLETGICKSIENSYYLSLPNMIISIIYNIIQDTKDRDSQVAKTLSEINSNEFTKEIHNEFCVLIFDYIITQHNLSLKYFLIPILSILGNVSKVKSEFRKIIDTTFLNNNDNLGYA